MTPPEIFELAAGTNTRNKGVWPLTLDVRGPEHEAGPPKVAAE